MSMILQKYKSKRKLGKGAYGDVLLCEDLDGKQIAIKMINKKVIQKDPYLQQYLQGQKQVMMSVKSKYVMELYAFQEDDNYMYFICEYCEGGDLLNYQAKQPNKVFDLKTATLILSQVINGLQLLHYKGYLHRDIKPQNILLKKTAQQGKYLFKLADFGFAKKNEDVGGTVLGTEHYMSPEIYMNQTYSYEVDMWAFGVLFYFMLNMEFPFRINPHAEIEQKREQLIKQSTNFSYSDQIKKSKKKIMDNCTPQMEDLFKKMFSPNGSNRITFVQIREHPVFRQHFPVIENQSRILYKSKKLNRYDSFVQGKISGIQMKKPANNNTGQNNFVNVNGKTDKKKQQKKQDAFENATPSVFVKKAVGNTGQQKNTLQTEFDKIDFLQEASRDLIAQLGFIDEYEKLAFRYNVLKYYIILMRQFCSDLKIDNLDKKYPKLKWKQFLKTSDFNQIRSEAKQKLDSAEINLSQCYDQCRHVLLDIKKINPYFQSCLEPQVTTKELEGQFKQSYRNSTNGIFQKVRQRLNNGNKFAYWLALIVLLHSFNQLFASSEAQLRNIFSEFVNQKKLQGKLIQFGELKNWLSISQKNKIKPVIKNVLNQFFN